jgi:hypothetical protein
MMFDKLAVPPMSGVITAVIVWSCMGLAMKYFGSCNFSRADSPRTSGGC